MGMEQTVRYRTTPPAWSVARDLLAACDYPLQMRMIDGHLAFPDDQPPEAWRELRLGTPQGMITVRREVNRLVFVTWGNAEAGLRQAWNALAWAFAAAGGGEIETEAGLLTAEEFRSRVELPPSIAVGG
jgi:hypothetical protein